MILKLKHWQIFFILMGGLILDNLTIENNQTLSTTLSIIGTIVYSLWPLLIGHGLYQFLPNRIDLNYNLFVINSFLWLTAYIVVMIISDGQGMEFNGVKVLPALYIFYAILNYLAFPARILKSMEQGRKAVLGEYLGYFFLIVFLPIGIWFLQPRINKLIQAQDNKIQA